MYISPTRMMLFSPHLVAAEHQHVMIQFTCSLEGKPFSVWTKNDGWQQAEAVLINSGVAHSVKDFNGWQVTICIIPDVAQGRLIQEKMLTGKDIIYLETKVLAPLLPGLQAACMNPIENGAEFNALTAATYNYLLPERVPALPLDERITRTLAYIRQHIHTGFSAATLAEQVHLSEDRFLHLFKEQTGAPLRQYILWQRLSAATQLFVEGRSAKEAAYEAGFSDPAHFSRTFQQMFGASPSMYTALKPLYHFSFFDDL